MASDPAKSDPSGAQRRAKRRDGARGTATMPPIPMRWPAVDQGAPQASMADGNAQAEREATSGPAAVPLWLRARHLLPLLSMELSAVLGVRLRLRPSRDASQAISDPAMLGSLHCREGRLLLAMDEDAAMELLAAVYGSDRAANPPETAILSDLTPGNASWAAFGALVRAGAARALRLAGAEAVEPASPSLNDRIVPRTHMLPITLSGPALHVAMEMLFVPADPVQQVDADGGLADDPAPAFSMGGSGTPEFDPVAGAGGNTGLAAGSTWDRQMDALSRAVPVPVTLELCAQEWSLPRVMALAVGDVIALPPVRTVVMKVAGARWAEVPMTALTGPANGAEVEEGRA